jgi:hypothetical protein
MAEEHDTHKPQPDTITFPFRDLRDAKPVQEADVNPHQAIDTAEAGTDGTVSTEPETTRQSPKFELVALLQQVKAELTLLYEKLRVAKLQNDQKTIDELYARIDTARSRQVELVRTINGDQPLVEIDTSQADVYLNALALETEHILTRPDQLLLSQDTFVLSSGHLYELTQLLLSTPLLQEHLQELVNPQTVYRFDGLSSSNGMLMTIRVSDMVLLLEQAQHAGPDALSQAVTIISQELRNCDLPSINSALDITERMVARAPDDPENRLVLLTTRTRRQFAPAVSRAAQALIPVLDRLNAWDVMSSEQMSAGGGNSVREEWNRIIQRNEEMLGAVR